MSNIPIVSTADVSRVAASGGRGDIPPEVAEDNSMDPAGALGAYFFCFSDPPRMVSGKTEAGKILILLPEEY